MNFTSTSSTGDTLYHCPCEPPYASTSYHKLPSLYFCEECDSIHCPECVLEEVSSYFCPNCLFEVPSASVRAEKNRCARNCFLCPCCANTLAVVPSDTSDPSVAANLLSPQASVGDAPYLLACPACKWDSKGAGITFDKPTGLAGQLQSLDETSSLHLQYQKLQDHLEPWLKAGLSAANAARNSYAKSAHHSSRKPTTAIAAAARALSHSNTTISRDIPSSIASASRFNSLHNLAAIHRSGSLRSGITKTDTAHMINQADELKAYSSDQKEVATLAEVEADRAHTLQKIASLDLIPKVDQKACISVKQPLDINKLHPLRIPLRSRRTKRCPTCRHIVVKPDTKAASIRFKIRLVASSYLPQITVYRRISPSLGTRLSAVGATNPAGSLSASRQGRVSSSGATALAQAVETLISIGSPQDLAEPLRPGRNFSFHLSFTNPLYEPVQVTVETSQPLDDEEGQQDLPFEEEGKIILQKESSSSKPSENAFSQCHVSMPSTSFGINPFAEAWEYDAEDDDESVGLGTSGPGKRKHAEGVLAKKANKTAVQLNLSVGRDASGEVRVPLYITYTYTAEDPLATAKDKAARQSRLAGDTNSSEVSHGGPAASVEQPGMNTSAGVKSFSFWASVPLGRVVPRAGVAGGSTLNVRDAQARRVSSTSNLRITE